MDKVIEKKTFTKKRIIVIAASSVFIILSLSYLLFGNKKSRVKVSRTKIRYTEVKTGTFKDYISFQGSLIPINTIFLDAQEGGQIESILRQNGDMVRAGDPILSMQNTDLHLNIMSREANLAEQMNNLRNTRLSMDQNRLNLRRELLDIERQLSNARRNHEKYSALFEKDMTSENEYERVKDDFDYYTQKKQLIIESQKQDSIFRSVQIEQLEGSVNRLRENLSLIRNKLNNLQVRAPIDGQVVGINAEIGENIAPGRRLARIVDLSGYKIQGGIDEHYISRISIGLPATIDYHDSLYSLEITHVDPTVTGGSFAVELDFTEIVPENIRIGQRLRVNLELGQPEKALLIPRGQFYQHTGGQWIYVLDESRKFALKREINISRQNPDFYEVTSGLNQGEFVITSDYGIFGDADKVIFKD